LSEAADLLADLVSHGVRTICFLRSRRGIELIQRFTRDRLAADGKAELAERIAPYRGGYTPQQRRRLEVKPGITGWAQVQGRAGIPWEERIELDVWYVDHRSLALDLRILGRTFVLLITGHGLAPD
jgi:hypothetical protein